MLLVLPALGALTAGCGDLTDEVLAEAAPPVDCAAFDCAPKLGSSHFAGEPGAGLRFLPYPATRQDARRDLGPVLIDILDHLPPSYGSTYHDEDPITHGHETSHGIHSDVRNNHNDTGRRANGFYVLDGRAVVIPEPGIRKSHVAPFVPQSLRGSRYTLYISGSPSWDDTPLYVFDEWNAYVNGSAVGVDMVQRGLWRRGWRDGVAGSIEFTIYALAVGMAVEQNDAAYFGRETQFKEFLAFNTKRAMTLFRAGRDMEPFRYDAQETLYNNLRTSADAEAMRAFARRLFGEAWADAVLFGDGLMPDDLQPPAEPDPGAGGPADADGDGIADAEDQCSASPAGRPVWSFGEWKGCASGQFKDAGLAGGGPDADGDGVPDAVDKCSGTATGKVVWRQGDYLGCAGGQFRDGDR